MTHRVLFAHLAHETHGFAPGRTTRDTMDWRSPPGLLNRRGDGSPVCGALAVADAERWNVVAGPDASALPGPLVDHAVFEAFWEEMLPLAAMGADGVLLLLHGAMATDACDDPEGELLARLRDVPALAAVPIVAVLDLHASVSDRMAAAADALIAYRQNPHVDGRESGARGAGVLAQALATGHRPRTLHRRVPVLWPPSGTGTADPPMATLRAMADAAEAAHPGIACVNVIAGFAYADVPDAGVSVSAVITDPASAAHAARVLDDMAEAAWLAREAGLRRLASVSEVLAGPIGRSGRPDLIVEPADNIGGGATGDATAVLRALLDHALPGPALVAIADPAAVAALEGHAPGATVRVAVGGRRNPFDDGPVELEATLVSRSDGRFRLLDPNSHLACTGSDIDMGSCVVLRAGDVTVLVTSVATPPFDLGQFASQGIDVRDFAIVGVKAAVGHRQAYDPVRGASYEVETAALCPTDIARLPFRRIRRPIFPLNLE